MIGIGLIVFVCIWVVIAIWIGAKLSNIKLFSKFTKNNETGQPTTGHFLLRCLFVALVFLLPLIDQIIAYPKWRQLCEHSEDYEFGPNMDAKKAFDREIYLRFEHLEETIFPGVDVSYTVKYVLDAKTNQLILKKPHFNYHARAFLGLPVSSGGYPALLLKGCVENYEIMDNGENVMKKLQLKEVEN
ncbi:MAG: hypothetical protein BVN35_13515 [Proteobacteria bacterium ST_bin11]|jgi:hypothetical protein|nr:MAG: hypothetical protein BVN35_13515 [Proteobacteria bacterium ST_bin11]